MASHIQSGDLGNGFQWEYNPAYDTLTISGKGRMPELAPEKYDAGEYWSNTRRFQPFEKLILSDDITEISSPLFEYLSAKTVVIGKGMSSEKNLAGIAWQSFQISAQNDTYVLYDDALYTKDYQKLVSCPREKTSLQIHKDVQEIGDYAFLDSQIEGTIILPWGIQALENQAFCEMGTGGENVTIILPDTVRTVHQIGSRYNTVHYIYSENMVGRKEMEQRCEEVGIRINEGGEITRLDSVASYYDISSNVY